MRAALLLLSSVSLTTLCLNALRRGRQGGRVVRDDAKKAGGNVTTRLMSLNVLAFVDRFDDSEEVFNDGFFFIGSGGQALCQQLPVCDGDRKRQGDAAGCRFRCYECLYGCVFAQGDRARVGLKEPAFYRFGADHELCGQLFSACFGFLKPVFESFP